MNRPWRHTGVSGSDYDTRIAALERAGQDIHGEADFVESFSPATVLDAGCGTGRVAIELARRGISVAGIDRDTDMLNTARGKAPQIDWYLEDLATFTIPDTTGPDMIDRAQLRRFDVIVMAGNVMIFVDAGTEEAVIANMARHLSSGGRLISGFQLHPGGLALASYDSFATRAGLELAERWSTWDRDTWTPNSDYAVSVHQLPA